MAFVLDDAKNEIEETRSLEPLKKLKKENLVKVIAHYGITPAVGATKTHILDLIKDHCIENNIIDEVEEKPITETAEILRLKFEPEQRRLANEEAQRARKAAEAEAQKARELRLAELLFIIIIINTSTALNIYNNTMQSKALYKIIKHIT